MIKIVFEIECKSLAIAARPYLKKDDLDTRTKKQREAIIDNLAALYGLVISDETFLYRAPKITSEDYPPYYPPCYLRLSPDDTTYTWTGSVVPQLR